MTLAAGALALFAAAVAFAPAAAGSHARRRAAVKSPLTESLAGRYGGVLTAFDEVDFEDLDPGSTYYSVDYTVIYATQRPLYSDAPNSTRSRPDLASGPPLVSPDGRTVTVKLRGGVHFSPPVNREVTAADVAYAIERGANPHVANPYIHAYFDAIEGMPHADGGPIPGIVVPNRHEIVFKLTEPRGGALAQALQLPLTAPVPASYARRFDRHKPSDYAAHEVATGPYMLRNRRDGRVLGIGYVPGLSATLVRNPNWRRATDFRPAYLDAIHIEIGGEQTQLARRTLRSNDAVDNEGVAPSTVAEAYVSHPGQLEISPDAGSHYIGLDSAQGPFANIDVRKALWAALDRVAMDRARGGPLLARVMTHFIDPGVPGFQQAGGYAGPSGPQFDFNQYPQGNLALAQAYLRLAGYPEGRYSGVSVTVVGAREGPAEQDAEIVNNTLRRLGFTTRLLLVPTATMYATYCNVPSREVDVCPSVGWIPDFADPETVLDATFNGARIQPQGNVNWSQTNVPRINAAMAAAETIVDPGARAAAWAKIDDELVEDAAAIPFDWANEPYVAGTHVAGVGDLWNIGSWDYSFTSLRRR